MGYYGPARFGVIRQYLRRRNVIVKVTDCKGLLEDELFRVKVVLSRYTGVVVQQAYTGWMRGPFREHEFSFVVHDRRLFVSFEIEKWQCLFFPTTLGYTGEIQLKNVTNDETLIFPALANPEDNYLVYSKIKCLKI